MKKNYFKILVLFNLLLAFSFTIKAQDAQLKVTDGILYTVNGKWGNNPFKMHYSNGKGFNYRANIKVAHGEQTLEYYFLKDKKVYNINFIAQNGKKYLVCNENDKPVVKEDKIILTNVKIVNVSSTSSENGYQIVPSVTDTLQVATLIWDIDNDYFSKYKSPVFILRKIDDYWGDGSTGYISGRYNDITKDAFKVKLPSGNHTLSAWFKLGSYYTFSIKEFNYNFEAGKKYTIVFDNFGVDAKKNLNEQQINRILGSAKIVEIRD